MPDEIPEPKTKRVLLCGGHLDGEWIDVPDGLRTYRVLKHAPITLVSTDAPPDLSDSQLEVVYELEPMPIRIYGAGGGPLWVGAVGWGPGSAEAILRALFQRDVAQQLLGGSQ